MLTDTASQPMALYGALCALFILGMFIGTWWFYGIRAPAKALARMRRH